MLFQKCNSVSYYIELLQNERNQGKIEARLLNDILILDLKVTANKKDTSYFLFKMVLSIFFCINNKVVDKLIWAMDRIFCHGSSWSFLKSANWLGKISLTLSMTRILQSRMNGQCNTQLQTNSFRLITCAPYITVIVSHLDKLITLGLGIHSTKAR